MGMVPDSNYFIVQRRAQSPFLFQMLPDLCPPFGARRSPAYQFTLRLKDYEPGLTDAIILSSTASTDINLITRSKSPLGPDGPANVFVKTAFTDEAQAATLPMSESGGELSTIGFALDLSSTDRVMSPIPGEEIMESSTPLPCFILLTNEGYLLSWWFIYSEAIRHEKPYRDFATLGKGQPSTQPTQPQPRALIPSPQQPSFGQTGFGQSQAIEGISTQPTFGKPTFGAPSMLGGGSIFGKTNTLGTTESTFGTTSGLGLSSPQFGKPSFAKTTAAPSSGFGQPSALGGRGFASFASPESGNTPTSTDFPGGGFSAFAGSGGFKSVLSKVEGGESLFGTVAGSGSPFGKLADSNSPFSKIGQQTSTLFGASTSQTPGFGAPAKSTEFTGLFGAGSGSFQLGTTFKRDEKATDDNGLLEKSEGSLSLGATFGNMLTDSPTQQTPTTEDMDGMEDEPETRQSPENRIDASKATPFRSPQTPQSVPTPRPGHLWSAQAQLSQTPTGSQDGKVTSLLGSGTSGKSPGPSSPLSETIKAQTPVERHIEAPLPPDPTSKTTYGPGDTSASSSNVSKSSVEDAPLPPDPIKSKKLEPSSTPETAPLPPDFLLKPKIGANEPPSADDAPLPPDFVIKQKTADSERKATINDAPLPPHFLPQVKDLEGSKKQSDGLFGPFKTKDTSTSIKKEPDSDEQLTLNSVALPPSGSENEEEVALPEETDASDGDFEDSGEEITHELSSAEDHDETQESLKMSPESSFGGALNKAFPAGELFTKISATGKQAPLSKGARPLFGEISKPVLAPTQSGGPRSPSPVRPGGRKDWPRSEPNRSISAPGGYGNLFGARKTTPATPSLLQREVTVSDLKAGQREPPAPIQPVAEVIQSLSDDDEEVELREQLARPISPVPSLDPFVSHQGYSGSSFKPGIPGQIERLYRDINSMVDTLGINSRSISGYLLYQDTSPEYTRAKWAELLQSSQPFNILDETLMLSQISDIESDVELLGRALEQHRVQGVQDKLDQCQQLLSRDVLSLRGQFSSIQKTLDAYTDLTAVQVAPLSAEQANLQQELRRSSSALQSKIAGLEEALSLLRAKLADVVGADSSVNGHIGSRQSSKKPTVEAVVTTISTMMSMAESRSSDVDVLEAQMKKLGLDITGGGSGSHEENSSFVTPLKKSTIGRFPATPGSHGSQDGRPRSAYHTPESMGKHRASIQEPAWMRISRHLGESTRSESVNTADGQRWKERVKRRKEILDNLKAAAGNRKIKVRSIE